MPDTTQSLTTLAVELHTTREAVHAALRDITADGGPLGAHDALERIHIEKRSALVGEQHVETGQSMEIYLKPEAADLVRLMLCPCLDDRDAPGFDAYQCQAEGCHSLDRLAGAYDPGPQRSLPTYAQVTKVCPHTGCGWSVSWFIDDGSAESDLNSHIKAVHNGNHGAGDG